MSIGYKLSVIIPNYNNAKYLKECLNSVLAQTYKNIEIIIIDDVSTDESKIILDEYSQKFPQITAVYNENNQGVTKNRDVAISLATGEYITTLDSDDYYLDEKKLEKEIEIIKRFNDQGKNNVIAFSNIVLVDKDGNKLNPHAKNKIQEGAILLDLFSRTCMIPRDFIFSKKQYEEVGGYDSSIPLYEDWDLKLRLAEKNEFFYSGLDGIAYRRHGKGLSSIDSSKHIVWIQLIYRKNIQLVELKDRRQVFENIEAFLKSAHGYDNKLNIKQKIKKILRIGL